MTICSFIKNTSVNILVHICKYTHRIKSRVDFPEVELLCQRIGPLKIESPTLFFRGNPWAVYQKYLLIGLC